MKKLIEYVRGIIKPRKVPEDAIQDGGESAEEPKPMFYVGDRVVLYNPYEGGFMNTYYIAEPTRFIVMEYDYDEEQGVFRYRLESEGGYDDYADPDEWYSEEWLSLPTVSTFVRTRVPTENTGGMGELAMRKSELEREIESKALADEMDEELRKREVDRFLDLLREGTPEERKQAEKELRKLTREGR